MFYLKEGSHVDKYFSTDYLKHHLQSVQCSWQFDPSKRPNLDLLIFSLLLNSWWDVWSTTPKIERIDTKHVMAWKMYGLWLFWGETPPENPENPPWTIHLHDSWVPNVSFPGCNASPLLFGVPQCLEKKTSKPGASRMMEVQWWKCWGFGAGNLFENAMDHWKDDLLGVKYRVTSMTTAMMWRTKTM